MAIYQTDLTAAQRRSTASRLTAKRIGQPSAFLCHSHKDAGLALGLQTVLAEQGWDLYIDWQDAQMPDHPTPETASRIKSVIAQADWFLFLATENSMNSRWCPWEIGYADGVKHISRLAVVPTIDTRGIWYGNEYLGLYQKIDASSSGGLALFDTRGAGKWVRNI